MNKLIIILVLCTSCITTPKKQYKRFSPISIIDIKDYAKTYDDNKEFIFQTEKLKRQRAVECIPHNQIKAYEKRIRKNNSYLKYLEKQIKK